jgi:[glutamine synthetase] adenylyltransferase / [glutamine synthetase]-adenylyl-L-tyrosine phosphorylase
MENNEHYGLFTQAKELAIACSPFLSRLLEMHPAFAENIATIGFDRAYELFQQEMSSITPETSSPASLMKDLRHAKGKIALLTALADIAESWPLEQVTSALSDFAEHALKITVDTLLTQAKQRGEIQHASSADSGIIVLGMGKLGGRELNYSSDIDLIIFFESGKIGYAGSRNEQHFMNKLAQDIVHIMQERTANGYVFRTDLRLRPDPASTPPAVNTEAALYYYEGVGQNWERAAMIKARPLAGDIAAGERFLQQLAPFMWRRSLDFASINDIHSIKRQMDHRQNKTIQIAGHNVKLGLGGIREIEFFVQIHQLIWGGREKSLRTRATCETLDLLTTFGLVEQDKRTVLSHAYVFLRQLEHRLQMVHDAQTHSMPTEAVDIQNIVRFMGFPDIHSFESTLLTHLNAVHGIYASSFRSAEELGDVGNLVFTGVSHDPDTLETLTRMGYTEAERVSEIVMGWHHGSRRATRTKRARELLTELMPALLKRLSETADPDGAFLKFNEFLHNLPASVQLFSLFNANPQLLGLIADIMGSAPTLADTLSRSPNLLDAVLYADFFEALPSKLQLQPQLEAFLAGTSDFEERMDKLRQFRNEKQFQAGVQMLKQMVDAPSTGSFLSDLADVCIESALGDVKQEFEQTYGTIPDSDFAMIALGKLGSQEMTFSSDIDLVFIYDVANFDAISTGEKGFTASVYFNRLAQRFLNALTGMGREGRLYEVDTRLRPSGKQGLLAVSTKALQHYFDELAWTFEYMAFTKARVVGGQSALKQKLNGFICEQLSKKRDIEKLCADVLDMRERIEKAHSTTNPWDIKYIRGGMTDIDFIAQYLLLAHASDLSACFSGSAHDIFTTLKADGKLPADIADSLIQGNIFLGQIFNMLRLCCNRIFDEHSAPDGLKKLLVESAEEADFASLKKRLLAVEETVSKHYITLVSSSLKHS